MTKKHILIVTTSVFIFSLFINSALAGYWWWSGSSAWKDPNWSKVIIFWSHHKMNDISKWKFCWRRKSNTSEGKNPCDYKTVIVHDPQAEIEVKWDSVFKFQVEGYNTKKKKWKTYSTTIVRPCFNARVSNAQVSTLCNP